MTIGIIAAQCKELAALVTHHTDSKADGFHPIAINKLDFVRESSVPTLLHGVVEPMLLIVVQGKKAVLLNKQWIC